MPWNLVILMGGTSPERAISLQTGAAMAEALRGCGHTVTTLDLAADTYATLQRQHPDCVVLALHGVPGEDGSVQGMLDLLGLPYTGSPQRASAIAIDKIATKLIARALGITVANDTVARTVEAPSPDLNYPLIVKGNTAGSTLGLTKINDPSQFRGALEVALSVSEAALIEECVAGTEISVCLLGNEHPRILPTPEIVSSNDLFDFEAKYTPGLSHHIYPPRCAPESVSRAEREAVLLWQTLGCAGCGRIDMIIDSSGTPILLEINTVPGMTAVSILPDAAQQVGITFPELCGELVHLALARVARHPSGQLPDSAPSGASR